MSQGETGFLFGALNLQSNFKVTQFLRSGSALNLHGDGP
jgi:hypothetical protein